MELSEDLKYTNRQIIKRQIMRKEYCKRNISRASVAPSNFKTQRRKKTKNGNIENYKDISKRQVKKIVDGVTEIWLRRSYTKKGFDSLLMAARSIYIRNNYIKDKDR